MKQVIATYIGIGVNGFKNKAQYVISVSATPSERTEILVERSNGDKIAYEDINEFLDNWTDIKTDLD